MFQQAPFQEPLCCRECGQDYFWKAGAGSQRLDLQWSPGKTLCKDLPASTEEPGERYP